ncbi:MAG: tetratricopeptide repeat protein [Bryobacteraceae bacterium]
MRLCKFSLLPVFFGCVLIAQSDAVADAVAALQRGDLSSAEQTLRTGLRARPNDVEALDVLGVVLDNQKKYAKADQIYRRAINLPHPSPGLLNNYGNHLLASGKPAEARGVFLKVLALNPAHVNAHVQLARISLERKSGSEALHYLDQLPPTDRQSTDVSILRMQALYAMHRDKEADALLAQISPAAQSDPRLSFLLGVALASAKQYGQAETFFSRTLETAPSDFDALYNLGLAASHAGHNERARKVLETALEQRPRNVDVLYDLSAVNIALNHKETALQLLAQAAQLAPERADVQLLLAHTTAEMGYFGDSIEAWNRYMKLVPIDDVGRRERGFAETALGVNARSGTADIEWFVRRHPNDPVGHYELGVVSSATDANQALAHFNRAIELKADFVAAHVGRALLNYRQGNAAAALPDLKFAAAREPQNATILDRLGETYLALDRPADALLILRKAAELAPHDFTTLMHFSRALSRAGDQKQASAVMARVRELGPNKSNFAHSAGLVEFLSLSPEEQHAAYRAGVERTVRSNPDNAEAQVQYLKLSLEDGKMDQAAAVSRQIIALKPSAAVLADAAADLLAAGQYPVAKEFLEQAVALTNPSPDLTLDLALATFHVANAQAALERMDRIPEAQRTGDYYLARAQMLDAAGRTADALMAVNQALGKAPTRPELYRQATLLLVRNHRLPEALQLLDQAARILPDNPEIFMMRANTLELAGGTEKAKHP